MIPNNEYDEDVDEEQDYDFEEYEEPSKTYAMYLTDDKSGFLGKTDDEAAVKQAILKILNTERYAYEIYSWDYGIELNDLIGKSMLYVLSEIEQRVTEAVTADDRIESVEDFGAAIVDKKTIYITFTAVTAQNEQIPIESEVEL